MLVEKCVVSIKRVIKSSFNQVFSLMGDWECHRQINPSPAESYVIGQFGKHTRCYPIQPATAKAADVDILWSIAGSRIQ